MKNCAGNHVPTKGRRSSRFTESSPGRGYRAGAFTLVELLIVVAVLAVLLSILLPTLHMTSEITRQMVCVSNMHGMGTAFISYTADWRRYPMNSNSFISQPNNWVHCGFQWPDWGDRKAAITDGSLWPYTQSLELYHCAQDEYNTYRSFSMNMYIGNAYSHHMHGYPLIYQQGAMRPTDITRSPSEVMVFVEERSPDDPTICYMTNIPTLRHMGNFCATFADGSGRPVKVFDERRSPTIAEETAAVNEWMATHFDYWGVKEGITPELP